MTHNYQLVNWFRTYLEMPSNWPESKVDTGSGFEAQLDQAKQVAVCVQGESDDQQVHFEGPRRCDQASTYEQERTR